MDSGKKQILVVEDDREWLNMLSFSLQPHFSVLQAADGEQAVSKIIDFKPDVILLDLLLPKLHGFKVLERVRQYPDQVISRIPVVVLSNLWSDKDILQAKALKINDYFVKANTKIDEVIKALKAAV